MAAILFVVITASTRSPFRALVAVIAWAGLFELTYQAIGIVGFGWALANFPWEVIALSGWLILAAVVMVYYIRPVKSKIAYASPASLSSPTHQAPATARLTLD